MIRKNRIGMSDFNDIVYRVSEGRAEITLDRPDVLNAFTPSMLIEINEAIQEATNNDQVYVIVLTGRGRGFCSGADVKNMDGRDDREKKVTYGAHLWQVQNVDRMLYNGPKPTIAAVNGPAIGAGCDFALACDLRTMDVDAFLRQQFVNIGLVPGDGGGWLLPRLIGESKAKEYLLTGRDISATDAEDLGLAVDVVDNGVMDAARDLADELRDKPATAMRGTKDLIDVGQSFEEYAHAAFEAQWKCVNDPEHKEAIRAFSEGRPPNYDREY
jgi:enoyl-CoA hydratase/carnithine racemase